MKTRRGTVLMIVIGVVLCVVIVGAGAAAWFFVSAYESAASDENTATRAFTDVRQRFGTAPPIIEIDGQSALLTRRPPATADPSRALQHVRILTWDPDERKVARITLPWWLLRLKETPIDLSAEIGAGFSGTKVSLSVDEIERYGPVLLVDHTEPDGSRVLVWTE